MNNETLNVSANSLSSTRLESFIRRLEAQRSCIDFAARPGHLPEGLIFELGLGDGRTYDHLRTVFRSREVFVFDRHVDPHPDCVPDSHHLFLGEIVETLPRVAPHFRGQVALLHLDISSGDQSIDRATTAALAPVIDQVAAPFALVASDQPLSLHKWQHVSLFEVPKHRYFLYRKAPARLALERPDESIDCVRNTVPVRSYDRSRSVQVATRVPSPFR